MPSFKRLYYSIEFDEPLFFWNPVKTTLLIIASLFFPSTVFASEESGVVTAAVNFNLTHHIVGYLSILFTVLAYVAAMSEEVINLRKSKPMVLGAALI